MRNSVPQITASVTNTRPTNILVLTQPSSETSVSVSATVWDSGSWSWSWRSWRSWSWGGGKRGERIFGDVRRRQHVLCHSVAVAVARLAQPLLLATSL